MTTIKATILATSYPLTPNSTSGIFVARLVDNFPENVSVRVIAPSTGVAGSGKNITSNNIDVFRYGPRAWEVLAHNPGGIPVALKKNKLLNFLVPIFLTSMFIKCIRIARNSDIIHANWAITGLVAGVAGMILRKPVVTTLRGEDITRAKKNLLDRNILKWCIKLNTNVVAVSESIRKWVIDYNPDAEKKILVIANGVEKSLLEIKSAEIKSNSEINILTIGSLIERKGIDQIIKAMSKIKDEISVCLTILGDGPEKINLESLAKSCDLLKKINFVGEVVPERVPNYLAAADIFILASHSEGRPNVILEAMASGLPVISSDIEGSNELIAHNKTGLLFGDGDITALANNIIEFAKSETYRIEISNNARNFIVDNDLLWPQTAQNYFNLYKLSLGKK